MNLLWKKYSWKMYGTLIGRDKFWLIYPIIFVLNVDLWIDVNVESWVILRTQPPQPRKYDDDHREKEQTNHGQHCVSFVENSYVGISVHGRCLHLLPPSAEPIESGFSLVLVLVVVKDEGFWVVVRLEDSLRLSRRMIFDVHHWIGRTQLLIIGLVTVCGQIGGGVCSGGGDGVFGGA